MSTEHIIYVLKSMYGIQILEQFWTSFESFIHKYIGYIWSQTLKVDDNIILIPFSTSLTFKMYSFCWFYVNNYKSVTDKTFKWCPKLFQDLYTIHGFKNVNYVFRWHKLKVRIVRYVDNTFLIRYGYNTYLHM
jgi:hypothetical protein